MVLIPILGFQNLIWSSILCPHFWCFLGFNVGVGMLYKNASVSRMNNGKNPIIAVKMALRHESLSDV